jgi:tRNA-dihydrouridine synthase A
MRAVVRVPVTVKHRIGVDERDAYEDMLNFVDIVAAAGCDRFSVHARKAWLSGLSPKQNREVPPLRYEDVYRLKSERPSLRIELNGGVRSHDAIEEHLRYMDGVMIGRWACEQPYAFARLEQEGRTRQQVVTNYAAYAEQKRAAGHRVVPLLRPLLNLYAGEPGTRSWKRRLDALCRSPGALGPALLAACEAVEAQREAWRESA